MPHKPSAFAALFGSGLGGRFWPWSVFAVFLLVAPLIFTSALSHTMLSQMGIAIIVCLSYNMLLGQGGMLSFGHAVYPGLGAFVAIHALNLVGAGQWSLPVSLTPFVCGVCAALVAALLGWVSTKKAATPFAMITLGVGELVWAMALMLPEFFGGEGGISGNRVVGSMPQIFGLTINLASQQQLYYLIALYCFICTALMFAYTLTPLGRMLNAVRDNPERVGFIGYNTQMVRYITFVVAGFFAGVAGGLEALHAEIVTSEVLSSTRSASYLLFTYLGGASLFFGPIIGAVLMVLALVLLSEITRAWLLYLGLVFVLMVMHAPGGVASLFVRGLRALSQGLSCGVWMSYAALAVTAAVALLGAAAMVEMLYHVQSHAGEPHTLVFLGVGLNPQGGNAWVGAMWVMLTGALLHAACRRQCVVECGRMAAQRAHKSPPQEGGAS